MTLDEIPEAFRRPVARHALLSQDVHWRTKAGALLYVRDMAPRHAGNTVAMLERSADAHRLDYIIGLCWLTPMSGASGAEEALDDWIEAQDRLDPIEWLHSTPLVKALVARRDEVDWEADFWDSFSYYTAPDWR